MKRKIFFLLLFIPILFLPRTKVQADFVVEKPEQIQIESKKLNPDAEILAKYLAQYDSPLQYHAQDFIDAAKKYNLDWKLLPSIAGVESTFGKQIPGGFNGWGWGVYGTQAIYFSSWKEAIFTIAQGLRENYFNKGLTEPYAINRIYAESPYWGGKVTYFMRDMEKFANNFDIISFTPTLGLPPKIAAVSGGLAF